MPRYLVTFQTGAFSFFEVEADSPKEAEDAAWEDWPGVSLCHQCSGDIELVGDFDIAEVDGIVKLDD